MQFLRSAGLAGALVLALGTAPAAAQWNRFDATVLGGWSMPTQALRANALGGPAAGRLAFDFRGLAGAQLGFWFNPRLGLRADFAYSDRPFEQSDTRLVDHVNLWDGTGDVLIRFVEPRPGFGRVEWLPYLALGAGAKWIGPAGGGAFHQVDDLTVQTIGGTVQGKSVEGQPIVCFSGICQGTASPTFVGLGNTASMNGSETLFLGSKTMFEGQVALGMDVRLTPSFALRVEAGDRFWQAPVYDALQAAGFGNVVRVGPVGRIGNMVQEIYFTGGLGYLFGLAPPPTVATVPAPAPPPPPLPPPPPPQTEEISVCLVDPGATGGLRTVRATHDLTSNDTTIVVKGEPTRLADATAAVPVATRQSWFIQGQPFEVGTGKTALRFVPSGGARMIPMDRLAYIGSVQGLPVYADASMLGPLQAFAPSSDLAGAVDRRPLIRDGLQKIEHVYVPTQASGCVFQPMQLQAEVKKTR